MEERGEGERMISRRLIIAAAVTTVLAAGGAVGAREFLFNPQNTNPQEPGARSETSNPDDTDPSIPAHTGLDKSSDPGLRVLSKHEKTMERGFDRMMLFRDIPDSVVQAERAAPAMAATLLEYKRFGIEPLVIFEPQGLDVNNIDPAIFTAYFKALVAHGVPPDAIGTWSLFPEPNLPLWSTDSDLGNTDRVAFGRNLENSAQALKQSFPQAKVMLLLDSATYASHDVDYAHKRPPETMLEYTNIQPGLVDEFCIQGFPWTNEARAKDFVSADLALAAAKKLGGPQKVKVSFNTGTFSQVAAPISGATATAAQREQNLNGILEQAKIVQQNGFAVAVNIFGADKMPDEANWSYVGGPSTEKLKAFIQAAARAGIRLSIFDE